MTIYYSPNNKGFYDDRLNYSSLPADKIEISTQEHQRLLFEINSNNKSIIIVNGNIDLEEKPPFVMTWEVIREQRNFLLKETDYTQLPDFPEAKKSQWTTYRQALRDIPQTYATPQEVIWPTPPT